MLEQPALLCLRNPDQFRGRERYQFSARTKGVPYSTPNHLPRGCSG
ncbi:hypothetical protein ABIB66_008515 [Bradyrhizobium sp. F1.13.3]